MVSLLSAKQSSYLSTVGNDLTEATASGSSFVFIIGLVLAVINLVFSLFMKSPASADAKANANAPVTSTEAVQDRV